MCRWMGSHFYDWIEYNGIAVSIELLEWGCTFSDFWHKKSLHILWLANEPECLYCRCMKSKVFFIQLKKWVTSFYDDLFKGLIR